MRMDSSSWNDWTTLGGSTLVLSVESHFRSTASTRFLATKDASDCVGRHFGRPDHPNAF